MTALQNYLKSLNSSESQSGVWVNLENPTEEYRTGQRVFENGGLMDDWIFIGSLENLSFGFQSTHDAFISWVSGSTSETMPNSVKTIVYKGEKVQVQPQSLYEAWTELRLDEEFSDFITDQISDICNQWSELAADDFITNKLPEILEFATAETY